MPLVTPNYVYPTTTELSVIDQDLLPVLIQNNPIFRMFPMRNVDSALVEWEQRDNYLGLMQARGLEGEYPVVNPLGITRYSMDPGRYGEHTIITGREIETRRGFGSINTPIGLKDIVIERQEQLATRQVNFMSFIMWSILTRGYYQTVAHNNAIIKRDNVVLQTYTATTLWSNASASTPMADFRAMKLRHRGHSVMFDGTAEAWLNTQTLNYLLSNTNSADFYGRKGAGLETIEGLEQYNRIIATNDNLPRIIEYDEGYLDNSGNFQLFIPDGIVLLIGRRSNGAPIGDFALTRNADAGNSSTPLVKVIEFGMGPNDPPPAKVALYRGFNGGPRIYYPGSIIVMTVA